MADGCTTCHDPHASDTRYQLHDAAPDLCFSCHDGIENLVGTAAVVHGPTLGGDSCVGCHDPHFTRLPYLQRTTQPALCLDCHNQPLETADGRVLVDMALLLDENPNHHGPIREGTCTACHQPHAAEHFRLLFMDYPQEFYAPFQVERYALCFSCHLSDLVQDRSGTGLTGFRDGDLNLHWLHVNQEKGRTCRACHEVHASKRPFHIREAVPFGASGWMLEINFAQSTNGGSCTPACHKARTYSRSAPAPGGRETIGDKGAE
jgi:predicted CXXCH cytochrome family protein